VCEGGWRKRKLVDKTGMSCSREQDRHKKKQKIACEQGVTQRVEKPISKQLGQSRKACHMRQRLGRLHTSLMATSSPLWMLVPTGRGCTVDGYSRQRGTSVKGQYLCSGSTPAKSFDMLQGAAVSTRQRVTTSRANP